MSVPVKFRNVFYYRIAGKYIFAGDLFIARRTIYFFPEIDLEEQRNKVSHHLPHEVAVPVVAIVYLSQKFGSYSSGTDFWKEGMSDEEFQKKAQAHVKRLEAARWQAAFSGTLPLPTHVSVGEISDMKLSLGGKLSFHAQSDTHDFNVGLRRKKRLRNALWEAGLGLV